ncbi:MAG: helix-turn-helix domain-containing protein [Desulfarculaceae bacterium]|jgi:DNA-binding NtrC family response regulator
MTSIKTLKEVRKEHIEQVLKSTKGDTEMACRILGVSPPVLRRLIKEHGLAPAEAQSRRHSNPTEE